jgi:hypothetical protein
LSKLNDLFRGTCSTLEARKRLSFFTLFSTTGDQRVYQAIATDIYYQLIVSPVHCAMQQAMHEITEAFLSPAGDVQRCLAALEARTLQDRDDPRQKKIQINDHTSVFDKGHDHCWSAGVSSRNGLQPASGRHVTYVN